MLLREMFLRICLKQGESSSEFIFSDIFQSNFFLFWCINKKTLTGTANCKKTTRHHTHLSLCAKSRRTNDAKSRNWLKTSIWAIFLTILRSNISKWDIFLKNRFHSNRKSNLVLTSGQKPKKILEPFLRKIWKCLILG